MYRRLPPGTTFQNMVLEVVAKDSEPCWRSDDNGGSEGIAFDVRDEVGNSRMVVAAEKYHAAAIKAGDVLRVSGSIATHDGCVQLQVEDYAPVAALERPVHTAPATQVPLPASLRSSPLPPSEPSSAAAPDAVRTAPAPEVTTPSPDTPPEASPTPPEATPEPEPETDTTPISDDTEPNAQRVLPITLLSGFLGAGKTSLLKHILQNKVGLKCAVIVNDMAQLNIDAALITNSRTLQTGEKMLHIENGCICCSMQVTLMHQIADLWRSQAFDYLIIESSGISQPHEVALAFAQRPAEDTAESHAAAAALCEVATLDTCVTVVDVSSLVADLQCIDTMSARDAAMGGALGSAACTPPAHGAAAHAHGHAHDHGEDDEDRNVAELLVEQIEFADVIVLNKAEMLSVDDLEAGKRLVASLNPGAHIVTASFGKVDVKEVISTGRFSLEKAAQSAGWLAQLNCPAGQTSPGHSPRHGMSSFVYTARAPFHPLRLHNLVSQHFIVQEPDWAHATRADAIDRVTASLQAAQAAALSAVAQLAGLTAAAPPQRAAFEAAAAAANAAAAAAAAASAATAAAAAASHAGGGGAVLNPALAAAKRATRQGAYGHMVRSKGFAWIAGAARYDHCAEWGSSGNLLRVGTGGPWFGVLPKEAWPDDAATVDAIQRDFLPGIEDRRQEIVFIGTNINEQRIRADLNACLCTPTEALSQTPLPDPFAQWPPINSLLGLDDSDDEAAAAADAPPTATSPAAAAPRVAPPSLIPSPPHASQAAASDRALPRGETAAPVVLLPNGVAPPPSGLAALPKAPAYVADLPAVKEEATDEIDQYQGVSGDDFEAAQWMPGGVVEVIAGGSEFFKLIASAADMGIALVVVHWNAHWSEACEAAAKDFDASAATLPGVMFLRVEVEASRANTSLAFEKVMRRSDSRRTGAKPILKSGRKFPCFTAHDPAVPARPTAQFEDTAALSGLSELLREHSEQSQALAKAMAAAAAAAPPTPPSQSPAAPIAAWSREPSPAPGNSTAPRDRSVSVLTELAPNRPAAPPAATPLADAAVRAIVKPAAAPVASSTAPSAPSITFLKQGGKQLKTILLDAKARSVPLLVLFANDCDGASDAARESGVARDCLRRLAVTYHDLVYTICDVSVSAANQTLCESMSVRTMPTFYMHHDGRDFQVEGFNAAKLERLLKKHSTVPRASKSRVPSTSPKPEGPQTATVTRGPVPDAWALTADSSDNVSPTLEASKLGRAAFKPAATAQANGGTYIAAPARGPAQPVSQGSVQSASQPTSVAASVAARRSQFDPPPGKAKAGVVAMFPGKGSAVYWPRMPCLRCGCPWWTGEDWDATCVRCGWGCEADGYDDDSQPLAAGPWRARHTKFTAILKTGRTAQWPPPIDGSPA